MDPDSGEGVKQQSSEHLRDSEGLESYSSEDLKPGSDEGLGKPAWPAQSRPGPARATR